MTSKKHNKNSFTLGSFIFSHSAFTWANKRLMSAINSSKIQTIIIDEYGPLEFREVGFEPLVSNLIKTVRTNEGRSLIILIRESLLQKLVEKFHLSEEEVNIKKVNTNSNQWILTD